MTTSLIFRLRLRLCHSTEESGSQNPSALFQQLKKKSFLHLCRLLWDFP